jgi:hypothetical protein
VRGGDRTGCHALAGDDSVGIRQGAGRCPGRNRASRARASRGSRP